MPYLAIVQEIADILKTVDGTGRVYMTERHTDEWSKFFERFKDESRILVWEVTRVAVTQEIVSVQGADGSEPLFHDTHDIRIRGMLGLRENDDEEKNTAFEFQGIIDKVRKQFRINQLLNGLLILPVSPQGITIGHKTFGGVFCHFCELQYFAVERVVG